MHFFGKENIEIERQQLACTKCVGVGEASRDDEHLVIRPCPFAVAEFVDVDNFGIGTGKGESCGDIVIAVSAVGMEDEGARFHGRASPFQRAANVSTSNTVSLRRMG